MDQQAYLERIADAGLTDDYNAIIGLVKRAIDVEDERPQEAVALYRKAYDRAEAATEIRVEVFGRMRGYSNGDLEVTPVAVFFRGS